MSKITNTGVHIVEAAAAAGDTAGEGQIWVKNDTPSSLYYTDDAGTDFKIGWTVTAENTTTGGTSIDFTGIPAGIQYLVVMWNAVAGSGSSFKLLQLGDSGGIENSGYVSVGQQMTSGANYGTSSTAGFLLRDNDSAERISGHFILTLEDASANTWTCSHSMITSVVAGQSYVGAGAKSLSGTLDRVRMTTVNGSDTYAVNGGINIAFT